MRDKLGFIGEAVRGTFLKESFPYNPSKNLKTRKYIINFSVAFFCLLFFRERKVRRVLPYKSKFVDDNTVKNYTSTKDGGKYDRILRSFGY